VVPLTDHPDEVASHPFHGVDAAFMPLEHVGN
jgi:hypothetical protein